MHDKFIFMKVRFKRKRNFDYQEVNEMRTFEKSSKLDYVCYDIRGPIMDEAQRMSEQGIDILKLNIGNPAPFGFKAPKEIEEAIGNNAAITEGYSDSKGLVSAREAILKYCQSKNMPNVSIDDIYTGNGVSELITMSMNGLLNYGDEVLVPMPDYPLWTASVTLAGGKAVHYRCDDKQNWYPDIKDMESKITPKTKAIVVINPNNPTGALYPTEILEQIVDLARKHELILFADEIYDRLVMDGKEHIALSSLAPDLLTVSFNGLSKSHLIAGYRCGWMVLCGEKKHAKGYIEGIKLLSAMRLCSNVPAQSLIPVALDNLESTKELLVPGGRIYEQREVIYNALNEIDGLSVVKPTAAFYMFPKLDIKKFGIIDDEKFVLDFLKEKHILFTHGGGFHWDQPDHFRVVFLPEVSVLSTAADRLNDFLSTYHQN
jgi:alanine-synthesizing transaminase